MPRQKKAAGRSGKNREKSKKKNEPVQGKEGRILKDRLKYKNSPIPRGVSYWAFFHNKVLERQEVREDFADTDWDCKDFDTRLQAQYPLKVHAPRCVRKRAEYTRELIHTCFWYYKLLLHSSSPFEVKETPNFGLGLFLKDQERVKKGGLLQPEMLLGLLFDVGEAEANALHKLGYPSIYGTCVMTGPVALMNHQCHAPLFFTKPTLSSHIEEFQQVRCIRVKAKLNACTIPTRGAPSRRNSRRGNPESQFRIIIDTNLL